MIAAPQSDVQNDPLLSVQYNYFFGTTWEECGVSKADGLLTALGFSVREEVTAFCASVNVFNEFSTEKFLKTYVSSEDKQRLSKFGKAQNQIKLFPVTMNFSSSEDLFKIEFNPGYEDFFQALFTWLTRGENTFEREKFISWWQNPVGQPSMSVRNAYAIQTDSVTIRQSFKDKIDAFLQERRNPQKSTPDGSSNPFVDGVHFVKNYLLKLILSPSDWGYVSGTDVSVGVQTPLKLVSAGAGGGTFGVYNHKEPKTAYPLKFAMGSVGAGFGPSLPVSLSINPEALPSAGKIYHGFGSRISGDSSFYGFFLTLSVGAADVLNQTSALMFIAPYYVAASAGIYPGMDGAKWAEIFAKVIPLSSAIIALDGNGVETSISVSAQLSCGFVGPNK